ncbi:MAG: FapA family protein, partial [Firmicutes bacterium]|nr:FapA family protein [Bacillota bacterium]
MATDDDTNRQDGDGEVDQPPARASFVDCVAVTTSRDGMLATVALTERPEQLEPVCGEDLTQLLRVAGITFGIVEQAALDELVANWAAPVDDVIVAIGKYPTASTDDEVILQFDPDPQPRPVIDEDDRADFRELGLLQNVTAGDLLA